MTTSRFPKIRRIAYGLSAAMTLSAGSGCIESQKQPDPTEATPGSLDWNKPAALTVANSCEEAENWLETAAITQMDMQLEANRTCFLDPNACGWYRGGVAEDATGAPSAPDANAGGQDDEVPDEYSETNTQVEGVDEADRVKNDGQHIYTLSNQDFVVVKSWPAAQTAELSRVRLRSQPNTFFLDGDRAIVLGYGNLYDVSPDAPRPTYDDGGDKPEVPPTETEPAEGGGSSAGSSGSAETPSSDAGASEAADAMWPGEREHYRSVATVTIIDLADRNNPRIVKEYFFDGYSLDSRRIDDKVYLAQNNYVYFDNLQYWPNLSWNDESDRPSADVVNAEFDRLRAANVAAIQARTLNDWLPLVWTADNGGDVAFASGRPVTGCTDVHAPTVFSGQGLLSLISLDLADGGVTGSTIQGSWGNVYASRDAMYIGSTNWEFFWWWRDADDVPALKTHIHKFAFDADGDARYSASGEVLGYAINQFAFDEHEGHLRVATTDGFGWWNNEQQTESRVTVLRQNGARLDQTGLVTGLGVGEQIFGVRFIGDQGYVVTFRQIDPLYVLDLADPTNPTVAGELKIPGFSSYIHPLADGFLLTAGRDGDMEGRVGGVKIEIFDVRNPADPKSVKTAVIGDGWNTWSDVLWDHKAFTYFGARNLLAIPVSGWVESTGADGMWWGEYKSELALFRVTTSDIEVLPSVSHMSFFDDFGGNSNCRYYNGYWQASIFRGVFVEDYVYSLSQLGLQVHDTRDLAAGPVAEVTLLDDAFFPNYDWSWCEGTVTGEDPDREGGEEPQPIDPENPDEGGGEVPADGN
jgi:hypothetical protein